MAMNNPENIPSTPTGTEKETAGAARTPEELLRETKETGRELTQKEMESVSGGSWSKTCCPECRSTDVSETGGSHVCNTCGHKW